MSTHVHKITAYQNLNDFVFGKAIHPVALKNGMVIGGGTVYPEINFTLPTMMVDESTMPKVLHNYREIITGICQRAVDLESEGFVAEIEILPPMTFHPEWGIEACKVIVDGIREYSAKYGLKGAVRFTPVDIREGKDLEHMYHGKHWDNVMKAFEGAANVGADFLAIESVGGKETHDEAIMYADVKKSLFALSVLGCPDMHRMWTEIVKIAGKTGSIPSGDTACGFANTAMVLADRGYIPKVFASTVRVMSAVRSLVAAEVGAKGPHKDCGYENVYTKAISGTPIATEGRTAACAHLSPVGNIAACMADLWSNESIQNIRLLGGMAPTVSFEQLVYDCRLMNTASKNSPETALLLRDLHADSDSAIDPQAYVLRPDVVLDISKQLVQVEGYYARTKKAAELSLAAVRDAYDTGKLKLSDKEQMWLDTYSEQIAELPADEKEFIAEMLPECEKLNPALYDLKV